LLTGLACFSFLQSLFMTSQLRQEVLKRNFTSTGELNLTDKRLVCGLRGNRTLLILSDTSPR
jgi:hypothetical protein